jgi:hypothetical protein
MQSDGSYPSGREATANPTPRRCSIAATTRATCLPAVATRPRPAPAPQWWRRVRRSRTRHPPPAERQHTVLGRVAGPVGRALPGIAAELLNSLVERAPGGEGKAGPRKSHGLHQMSEHACGWNLAPGLRSDSPQGDRPGVREPRRPLLPGVQPGAARDAQEGTGASLAVPKCPLTARLGRSLPICGLEQAEVPRRAFRASRRCERVPHKVQRLGDVQGVAKAGKSARRVQRVRPEGVARGPSTQSARRLPGVGQPQGGPI